MKLANKRILVVGMARSGVAAAQLLLENGATPVLSDRKPEDAFGGELDALRGTACEFRLAEDPVRLLSEVDGLVISPGVPIDAPVVLAAKEQGIPMVGELELAWSLLQGEVLAISGTNGKTTTTTLLGKIFENAGRVTHVAGNIGYPLSAVAMKSKKDDVVVVEVSSFQLESIKTFHPHVAALLNITEDHLNRHGTMAQYIRLKQRIFENQTGRDYAVLNMDDPVLFKMAGKVKSQVAFFSRTKPVENGAFVEDGNGTVRAARSATRSRFSFPDRITWKMPWLLRPWPAPWAYLHRSFATRCNPFRGWSTASKRCACSRASPISTTARAPMWTAPSRRCRA